MPMEAIPKQSEIPGMNHPGPIHLQQIFEGIYVKSAPHRQEPQYDTLYNLVVSARNTNLENNITNVENRQDLVVVVSLQL